MSATHVFILLAVFAVIAFIGRLVNLFRQSREVEKTLDYSKMREWKDDDDDWPEQPDRADDEDSPDER